MAGASFTGLWRWAAWLIVVLAGAHILLPFAAWLDPQPEIWRHLADTVLGELLQNTLILSLGVGLGVTIIGVGLAWLTAMCEFPGRRVFDWALMLPLALPAYVLAFVAIGLLDFSGPLQTSLRSVFGDDLRLPPIRSAGGAIAVLALALYPYVYLLARAAFLTQGRSLMESARMLGLSPWQAFARVALPTARPAIAAGLALALMETLADFGAVYIFNFDTFTTAIYKTWFGLFNLSAAAQLASLLLLLVGLALFAEQRSRGRARFYSGGKPAALRRYPLRGARAYAATGAALLVLSLAFVIPLAQLVMWSMQTMRGDINPAYLDYVTHTVLLSASAALLIVSVALLFGFVHRRWPGALSRAAVRFATLGYALPGTVLAVSIMLTFTALQNHLDGLAQAWLGQGTGFLLSSSVAALLFAYLVRFLAVGHGPVEGALTRITPAMEMAAQSLGATARETLWRIYLPLLRPGLLAAALLVFVEVMKEMPATLLLRPFGWDTLAVNIFELTSEGEWAHAALPALTLVLAGLFPVMLLMRQSRV
ncbi:MAG: iron ABC transporter permease [Gammaproteobacteria bacterium]|nr:MAG: iron ABC transporter permease [Gammaproteobacteria bacterium]